MNVYDEEYVADLIGVPREEVSTARKTLDQGDHWQEVDRRITLTDMGVRLVLVAFDLDETKLPKSFWPDLQKNARRGEAIQTIATFFKGSKNRQVCVCLIDGKQVSVEVHHHKNFVYGMEIPVQQVSSGHYRITRPCPRSRGRW